jgi:hypothetical protein
MITRDYTFAGALTRLPIIYGFAVPTKAFTKTVVKPEQFRELQFCKLYPLYLISPWLTHTRKLDVAHASSPSPPSERNQPREAEYR